MACPIVQDACRAARPVGELSQDDPDEVNALSPGVDWSPYFAAIGLPQPARSNVGQPLFFTALGGLFQTASMADWKTYLRWKLLNTRGAAPARLRRRRLPVQRNRAERRAAESAALETGAGATDSALGEALGHLYVAQAFPPAAKARALALVQNLKAALRDDLQQLPWISAATRTQAVAKLDAMGIKIGYPDKWRDYSTLDVSSPVLCGQRRCAPTSSISSTTCTRSASRVDRGEWGMTPPTVNAYYSPLGNEIDFPAGILQPPFFDAQADDASITGPSAR